MHQMHAKKNTFWRAERCSRNVGEKNFRIVIVSFCLSCCWCWYVWCDCCRLVFVGVCITHTERYLFSFSVSVCFVCVLECMSILFPFSSEKVFNSFVFSLSLYIRTLFYFWFRVFNSCSNKCDQFICVFLFAFIVVCYSWYCFLVLLPVLFL